jgi:hypothetical protein
MISQETLRLYRVALPDLDVIDPRYLHGEETRNFLGYEIVANDFCVAPDPYRMHSYALILSVLLGILFWPVCCIPCCLGSCYPLQQRAVYGDTELTKVVYLVYEEPMEDLF